MAQVFQGRRQQIAIEQLNPNCASFGYKNFERQGFQTFLPMEEEARQRGGKLITAIRPVFPGYIFVEFDVASGF